MINQGDISIVQILSVFTVNFVGLTFVLLILKLIWKKPKSHAEKLIVSIGMSSIALCISLVGTLDLGIYFWIKSGNIRVVFVVLPMFLCLSAFMVPMVVFGSYVQLSYWEKMQDYVDSWAKKMSK